MNTSFGQLFAQSWSTFIANISVLLPLGALLGFLPSVVISLVGYVYSWNFPQITDISDLLHPTFVSYGLALFVAAIISGLLGIMLNIAVTRIALKKKTVTFNEALKLGTQDYGRILGASCLYGLALIGLFLLLVVPGIIFSIYWIFFMTIVIVEEKGFREAAKESKRLVEGRWWNTFAFWILLVLIAGGMLIVVSMIVFIPAIISAIFYPTITALATDIINSAVQAIFAMFAAIFVAKWYLAFKDSVNFKNP